MNDADMRELEKYRAQKKKLYKYNNDFQKNKYRRVICLIPNEKADLFDKARDGEPISTYLNRLIDRDLKERGLLSD